MQVWLSPKDGDLEPLELEEHATRDGIPFELMVAKGGPLIPRRIKLGGRVPAMPLAKFRRVRDSLIYAEVG